MNGAAHGASRRSQAHTTGTSWESGCLATVDARAKKLMNGSPGNLPGAVGATAAQVAVEVPAPAEILNGGNVHAPARAQGLGNIGSLAPARAEFYANGFSAVITKTSQP
jgi:hypothetical protein